MRFRASLGRFRRQQHIPDACDMDTGFLCAISVGPFARWPTLLLSHVVQQVFAFFEHPQRDPEGFLDLFRLARQQRRCRERMAGVAVESLPIGVVHFPKYAAAVGAVVGDLAAQRLHLCNVAQHPFGDLRLGADVFRDRLVFAGGLMGEMGNQVAHPGHRNAVIDLKGVEGALRHLGISGILRVLDDRYAAAFLNRSEAGGAVIKHARENDANDAGAVRDRRRAKQGIDGGPVTVFPGALGDQELVFLDQEVIIGRRDDASLLKRLSIFGQLAGRAGAAAPPQYSRATYAAR